MFGGGGELSLNVDAEKVIYNDKCKPLVNIYKNLDEHFLEEVDEVISEYKLNKTSKQEFINLRTYYNSHLQEMSQRENAVKLYCLLSHSFNYQIAFNSKGEYNMPSGSGRSYFTKPMRDNMIAYINKIKNTKIKFCNSDFHNLDFSHISKDMFFYCDPPYLITVGAYERDYFCKWSETYEKELLSCLDILNNQGNKFALSNVIEHKGKSNDLLKKWSDKYNIHYLDKNYRNCSYQTKDRSKNSSVEVLITNY